MGKSVRHFLDCWLIRRAQLTVHWAGGPGISKINPFPIVAPVVDFGQIPLIVSPAPGVSFHLVAIALALGLYPWDLARWRKNRRK